MICDRDLTGEDLEAMELPPNSAVINCRITTDRTLPEVNYLDNYITPDSGFEGPILRVTRPTTCLIRNTLNINYQAFG